MHPLAGRNLKKQAWVLRDKDGRERQESISGTRERGLPLMEDGIRIAIDAIADRGCAVMMTKQ